MLSTYHKGHAHVAITRNTKVDGEHVQLQTNQPVSVSVDNHLMGGVDSFNQQIATHRILRHTKEYWKAMILDLIDIVNCYIFLLS